MAADPRAQPTPELNGPESAARPHAVGMARQPILDRRLRLVGYELLFRAEPPEAAVEYGDREATSAVIVDGVLDVGLFDLVGDRLAFLNVSRDFLLSVRPLPLPTRRVVLELLEDQVVDEPFIEVLDELLERRFAIALDDFRYTPETERLLPYAKIVKVDVLEHTGPALEEIVERLTAHRPRVTLLAEKVETREEFERCRELGFQLFQGYFFARPSRIQQERLPSRGLEALSAMSDINSTEDFEKLHQIITRDAGLSMRLLRYCNSAYLYLPRRVGSVREGLVLLGTITVRRFALMVALAGARDVPHELLVTALVRARMCQLLSGDPDADAGDVHFTVGLFSVADALVNAPMAAVLEQLPFRREIAAALLGGGGELGDLLRAVMAYERGEFGSVAILRGRRADLESVYREAVIWADLNIGELI